MTLEASIQALALILPDKALDYFDLVESSLVDDEVRFTLVEKNIPPKHEGATPRFHKYHDLMVSDFPIRGKRSMLTLRRRYWKVDGQKELLTNDIPLVFPGTKLEKDFAVFLKGSGRDRAGLLGKYRDLEQT